MNFIMDMFYLVTLFMCMTFIWLSQGRQQPDGVGLLLLMVGGGSLIAISPQGTPILFCYTVLGRSLSFFNSLSEVLNVPGGLAHYLD